MPRDMHGNRYYPGQTQPKVVRPKIEREAIAKLTNWQRNQWARAGYRDNARAFALIKHP